MLLTDICIKRPVFTTVLSLIIMTLGIMFFTKLQIRGTPNIDPPVINITARYPGADALYMEQQITTPIEKELKTIKNIDFIASKSSRGASNISLTFILDSDIEIALNDVRSRVSNMSSLFPDDMDPPSVEKLSSDNFPSLWISINSDRHDDLELTLIADTYIKNALERLPAVGESRVYGARYYSMRIDPINAKMYEHKITPIDIENAVKAQNKEYPVGKIEGYVKDFAVRLDASLNTPDQFKQIIVKQYADGSLIKLGDIAKVELAPLDNNVILRYNGKRAMAVGLTKQSSANIIELSKDVKRELKNIRQTLPKGIEINIAYDASVSVQAAIRSIFITLFEAICLVGLITYLFLGSLRMSLIPLVTIPISLIGTFSAMYFLGFSVNTFTLLAMILAIGLVVDDAIVMLENIFRHKDELRREPIDAALFGSREVAFAVIAMTITLASVFLPIGFIEGFLGKLFVEFAWTLAICVLFSGFVALTLTPMMTGRIIRLADNGKPYYLQRFDYYLNKIQEKYLDYLTYTINHKKLLLLISSVVIFILVLSFIFVNKTFIPQEDEGFLQVIYNGPEGSNVFESEKTVSASEQYLRSHKEVFGFFQVVGFAGGDKAIAFVPLIPWRKRDKSAQELALELNQEFSNLPGMQIFAISPSAIGGGGNTDKAVEFNIISLLDYDKLDDISTQFIQRMKENNIFQNIEKDFKTSTPTIDINVNRDKAYNYNVSLDKIGRTLQYLIAGKRVDDFRMGSEIYDVVLRYDEKHLKNISDIRQIFVKTDDGKILPIETIADIQETIAVKEYAHYNNARSIAISSELAPSVTLSDAVAAIENIAADLLDKNTTNIKYVGQIERMNDSSSGTIVTFLLALIFIYLVLSAQFESFSDALLIILSVPFSITGGVLALWIFGDTLNMYSNIGLVTLIGLITKNAIMLVEFTNQLRENGQNIKEAVMNSAKLRFRPILMTSTATMCGAVPLVLASGSGAASRSSIGLVIVFGMLIGTAFTMFVIPVLCHSFKR